MKKNKKSDAEMTRKHIIIYNNSNKEGIGLFLVCEKQEKSNQWSI